MGRLIMGYWRCKYCESYDIRGDKRECPNCGKSRDSNTKFYMKDPTDYIAPEDEAPFRRGPDWICPSCDSLNNAGLHACKSCGTLRESDNKTYLPPKDVPLSPQKEILKNTSTVNENPARITHSKTAGPSTTWLFIFVLLAWCVSLYHMELKPTIKFVKVVDLSWQREIVVENEVTVQEADWAVPAAGRLTDSKEEIHHYNQVVDHYETLSRQVGRKVVDYYETRSRQVRKEVFDGYETVVTGYSDLGNGSFSETTETRATYRTVYETEYYEAPIYKTIYEKEYYESPVYRQDPQYATKYYYDIERWLPCRTESIGGWDQNPQWPEPIYAFNEREGSRTETYYIDIIDDDGAGHIYEVSAKLWAQIEVGSQVEIRTYNNGTVRCALPKSSPSQT